MLMVLVKQDVVYNQKMELVNAVKAFNRDGFFSSCRQGLVFWRSFSDYKRLIGHFCQCLVRLGHYEEHIVWSLQLTAT